MQASYINGQKYGVSGYLGLSKALLLVQTQQESGALIVLVPQDLKEALQYRRDLGCVLPAEDILLIPPLDTLPYYSLSPNPDILLDRLNALARLSEDQNRPKVVITPFANTLRKTIPKNFFTEQTRLIQVGEEVARDNLSKHFTALGYDRVPLVEDRGTFAIRGGVIDVFSPAHEHPCRIDLFGDTVERLRFFNPGNQKTLTEVKRIQIIPAREVLTSAVDKKFTQRLKEVSDEQNFPKSERVHVAQQLTQGIYFHGIETFLPFLYPQASSVFDYLPSNSIICFTGLTHLKQKFTEHVNTLEEQRQKSLSPERLIKAEELFLSLNDLDEELGVFPVLDFDDALGDADIRADMSSNFIVRQKMSLALTHADPLLALKELITERLQEGGTFYLLASSPSQKERLFDLFKKFNLNLIVANNPSESRQLLGDWHKQENSHFLCEGQATGGFFWPQKNLWVLTDEELFGPKIRKNSVTKAAGEVFTSFSQLQTGDYVVHQDHGVGIYRGLLPLEINKVKNDFLFLEYLGGDKLYVPADQINKIHRFEAGEGALPLLDKMGGATWIKTREKVKKATRRLARELLDVQAKRKLAKGFAFNPINETFEEFEAAFPFEETPDQLKAIQEVLGDMESEKPMDRLVCGDVGYGKTEVAMRAAFKAVLDHKQVCVLVPTTVLSLQHFETFKKRFNNHGVNIAHMSRFQSAQQQKEILEKMSEGGIDIIIGTHRLLSRDVKFRDLGLLIIDEEHRFGVAQKEKMKKFKNLVDILALSATPIPRSLNFSLVGIRDLSVINTPPEDRLAIRTFLTHFDDTTLHEAISKELKRDGQVFFVHNRIQTIQTVLQRLVTLAPEARIRIGHGQMPEEELENVMIDFMHHRYDILLCTTIIESGLDIPNANTIIIDRADAMGLAQLYQLRGRVGRAAHRAYCYLLTPKDKALSDTARKRLDVIQRFTDLGAGFKIAMHDLEIRGAGNILGAEQSGHIAAIGYDLYVKLLEEAVNLLRTGVEEEIIDPEIKFPVAASIPEEMIPDTTLRLTLYKQLSSAKDVAACEDIRQDWLDRFGSLPIPTENLIALIKIKTLAVKLMIPFLSFGGTTLTLRIHPQSPIPTDHFIQKVATMPRKHRFIGDGRIAIQLGEIYERDILTKTWQQLEELSVYLN